jgi:hypothetical protein
LSSAYSVGIADAASATQASSPVLGLSLIPLNAASHSQASIVVLAPAYTLLVAPAASAGLLDVTAVSPKTSLVVGQVTSPAQAESVLLTLKTVLSVTAGISVTLLGNVTLIPRTMLVTTNLQSAEQTTSPVLASETTFVIDPAVSLSQSTSLVLGYVGRMKVFFCVVS